MNYFNFYTNARDRLIDTMVHLWVRGHNKEQEYLSHLLKDEEPLLAEPVFQSIFPWESSEHTFAEHASTLGVLKPEFVEALSGNKVDSEQRFPKDRRPYKHQTESWKAMLGEAKKTIVVTSGTGSGKTECFMVPVLQDLVNQNKQGAIQAIFLYPLNALMDSQRKRVAAWCKALNPQVTFAIYNGDTKEPSKQEDKVALPELISREAIRETPPQILFTNPTMLNYMLLRNKDRPILEKSQGQLRWILLDEAHTYTGSAAAELALQLRRVLQAFKVTVNQVNFAVTSATMGGGPNPTEDLCFAAHRQTAERHRDHRRTAHHSHTQRGEGTRLSQENQQRPEYFDRSRASQTDAQEVEPQSSSVSARVRRMFRQEISLRCQSRRTHAPTR